MRRSLLNKPNLLKSLRQVLVLFTLLILPSAAWADYTYGSDEELFFDCDSHQFKSAGAPIWTVSMVGESPSWPETNYSTSPVTYSPFASFDKLTLTRLDKLKGELTGFALKGNIPSSANVNIMVYKLATKDATSGTKIGSITINEGTTPTYTYTAENGISQVFDNEYIQLAFEHEGADASSIESDAIEKIILTFSGTSYGLKIDDVRVTSNNAEDILGDGNVSYSSNTLTLSDGVSLQKIRYSGSDNLTIAFNGNVTISSVDSASIASTSRIPKLLFSSTNGSLNLSGGNESVITGFSDVDFGSLNLASTYSPGVYYDNTNYLMCGHGINPRDLKITTEKYYPIWIFDPSRNNTGYPYAQLSEEESKSITIGEGSVSFNGDYTITINNITNFYYDGNTMIVVGPSMEQLTVNLVGTSSVASGSIALSLWDTTPLTFTTDETTPGSLTAPTIVSWMPYNSQPQGGQISFENGLVYNEGANNSQTISTTGVRIKIGETGISATGDIAVANGTASFNATTNTLTLTGATIGSGAVSASDIQVYVDDFKLEISGTCNINGEITYAGLNLQSSTIQINKGSGDASLTTSKIEGFGNCTWSDGLYLSAAKTNTGDPIDAHYEPYSDEGEAGSMRSYSGDIATITFSTAPSLWIGSVEVGSDGSFTGIDNVSFDAEKNILTLDEVSLSGNIISSLPNLTIKLIKHTDSGTSSIADHYIISSNPSATLTFTTDGGGYLSATIDNSNGFPWKGFSGNPTFDNKLVYTQNGDVAIINVLSAPTMSYTDGKLTLRNLSYESTQFSYYYAITYADNEGNISKTKKTLTRVEPYQPTNSDDITITHTPFTVEASVVYTDCFGNTTESDIATGKYFGFAEEMQLVTLASGTEEKELVLPEILPAVGEDDGITFVYESTDESIIYRNADSKWMIKGYGEASVSAAITSSDITVLNEVANLNVIVLHEPTFKAYYGDDETNVYNGKGTGNVSVEISCSDLSPQDMDDYTLMCYPGTDKTKAEEYDDEALELVSTMTVNAFIRYTNPDTKEYYDSEPVSNTYTVIQQLDIPSFEGSMVFQTYYSSRYSLQIPNGLKAYIITGVSEANYSVVATATEYIPKGVPILLEKDGDMPEGGYVAETYTGEVGDFSGNMLFYVDDNFTSINTSGNEYVLYNNEFIKATGTIAQGKCYLGLNGEVTSGTQPHSRGFSIDTNGGGTSGINEVISEGVNSEKWADGECYDLQGRRIQKPTKAGLYIVNGKKMVINNK